MPPLKAHRHIQSERRRFQRAQSGRAWSVKDLPQFYYHQNFQAMLDEITRFHDHALGAAELQFLSDFRALPHPAQCAYVRLAGRKGRVFDTRKLSYPEINALPDQYERLRAAGFAREITRGDFGDYLTSLPKPDLTLLLSDHVCETTFKKSWKKDKLIEVARREVDFDAVTPPDHIVVQDRTDALNFIYFLYFGRIQRNLQSATLKDLGLVKLTDHGKRKAPQYDDHAAARAAYFYADALYRYKFEDADDFADVADWPAPQCLRSERHRDRLLQKLGGLSERRGEIDRALSFYELSDSALCNERVVRLRYKQGETAWVQARLEGMIENPSCDTEHAFAEDFYARKFNKKRTSIVTDILREAEVLRIDEAFRNEPERAVLRHYHRKAIEAYRAENTPWKTLFALLFWTELYPKGVVTRALPESLKNGVFYKRYRDQVDAKLRKLDTTPKAVFVELLRTLSRTYGTPNGFIRWGGRELNRVKAMLLGSPPGALAQIMRQMADDYLAMKDGYPDLLVLTGGELRFIEVKAEGDALRRNQLTRIRQLRAAGFKADVLRVEWIVDPDQVYVVVDVETTGGRAGLHRVTEIGAVKMQGGEVIDTWQTLLNPQRSIPPNIKRLTGISEAMVADAPLFRDMADSFAAFMEGAIFAAHNVNFDYGFISAEFEMIDRKFRFPKICTCASMRKLYPGHRSYSLKNLCDAFQIELTSHHRALCDAKAAAELLKLVNVKRLEEG